MKVAWFEGSCVEGGYRSMDEIIASSPGFDAPYLRLLLVPDDFDLSTMRGDDWNDRPAFCNAGEPYSDSLPDGAQWWTLMIGQTVPLNLPRPSSTVPSL